MKENRRTANSLRRQSPKPVAEKRQGNGRKVGEQPRKKKKFEQTLFEMKELPNNTKQLLHSTIPTKIQAEKKLRSESQKRLKQQSQKAQLLQRKKGKLPPRAIKPVLQEKSASRTRLEATPKASLGNSAQSQKARRKVDVRTAVGSFLDTTKMR